MLLTSLCCSISIAWCDFCDGRGETNKHFLDFIDLGVGVCLIVRYGRLKPLGDGVVTVAVLHLIPGKSFTTQINLSRSCFIIWDFVLRSSFSFEIHLLPIMKAICKLLCTAPEKWTTTEIYKTYQLYVSDRINTCLQVDSLFLYCTTLHPHLAYSGHCVTKMLLYEIRAKRNTCHRKGVK